MQKSHFKKIAQIMCHVAHEELWLSHIDWARNHIQEVNLEFRVGSGKSTYHRHSKGKPDHLITFGARMVEDKFNSDQARCWKTGKEIEKYAFFDSMTLLNLLSHTIMHEFAHFMQACLGQVYKGSIHNHEFYDILKNAYESGAGDKVRARLQQACDEAGIDLTFQESKQARMAPEIEFNVGDVVLFRHRGKKISAIVQKINRKTLTVRRKFSITQFRVSPALLSKADDEIRIRVSPDEKP